MECKKESNKNFCTCTYPCDKHGACCDCVAFHRKNGELPGCFFPKNAEKTYNRTIEYYKQITTIVD